MYIYTYYTYIYIYIYIYVYISYTYLYNRSATKLSSYLARAKLYPEERVKVP